MEQPESLCFSLLALNTLNVCVWFILLTKFAVVYGHHMSQTKKSAGGKSTNVHDVMFITRSCVRHCWSVELWLRRISWHTGIYR